MSEIGEQPDEPGDDDVDAGFLGGLPDRGLLDRLPTSTRPPESFHGPVSRRRTNSSRSPLHRTTTKAEGATMVAGGADASWKNTVR